MNVDTSKMSEYAAFLEDNSNQILSLCENLNEQLEVASQCMDQESGRRAVQRMSQNIENIKKNVPISDAACKRLVLSAKYIDSARGIFGG